ncbi:DUF397 domain-containing protein [Streptomyces sp. H10-C2]|uniref:DUF397 domain-containing protein n=1 Tax=unclassified Streptomyces TaxID=2593676 RepID=UPI0024B979A4|nr:MULTISPECIES: DUF397 domain-containing protein [unclassified Streptomyces]MDJ0345327.1 DUF397 domain-containing protein [Streptomyces sp. PH10-H1]MDJ0374234.1 DUF397 domain-containing protein [Streptomyces sp. H10-C2]
MRSLIAVRANCLELAVSPSDGTIRLRESDAPGVVLTTTRARLAALLARIKADEVTLRPFHPFGGYAGQ